jgi:hypothetical protein
MARDPQTITIERGKARKGDRVVQLSQDQGFVTREGSLFLLCRCTSWMELPDGS